MPLFKVPKTSPGASETQLLLAELEFTFDHVQADLWMQAACAADKR